MGISSGPSTLTACIKESQSTSSPPVQRHKTLVPGPPGGQGQENRCFHGNSALSATPHADVPRLTLSDLGLSLVPRLLVPTAMHRLRINPRPRPFIRHRQLLCSHRIILHMIQYIDALGTSPIQNLPYPCLFTLKSSDLNHHVNGPPTADWPNPSIWSCMRYSTHWQSLPWTSCPSDVRAVRAG